MWNTGCNNIGNGLEVGINILDGENQGLAITVPPKGAADWRSVIFPWCATSEEVKRKAFRVANINSGKVFLYLFQNYHTDKVCWSVDLDNPWESRMVVTNGMESNDEQQPLSAVDIFIMPEKVWALAAESENQVFQTVFNDAMAVASTGGTIAQAIIAAALA
jgi:hypothetical protein